MTQVTTPLVGDLVGDVGKPPATVAADQVVGAVRAGIRRSRRWVRPVGDLLAAGVASLLTLAVGVPIEPVVMVVLVLAWPALLASNGRYHRRPLGETASTRSAGVLRSGAVLGLGSWVLQPWVGTLADPSVLVPATAAVTASALVTSLLRRPDRNPTRVALVGHPLDVETAALELMTSPRHEVAALCVSEAPLAHRGEIPMTVGVADAVAVARRSGASALLAIPGPDLTTVELRRLLWGAAESGIDVYVGTGLLDVAPARMSVTQGAGLDLIHVRPSPSRGARRLVKALFDRIVAALALLVLLPALFAVAVLVRRDSAGPAIFRQQRIGRDGQCFTMLKFRTMTTEAEHVKAALSERNESDGVLFKMKADPRVTRVGAVLRRYSVDELPQLVNVLLGQMSLVGPRPALAQEVDQYTVDPRRRLAVKPGLTGLWQVSGRSDLSWAESVRLDVRYVDNWSLRLDLEILVRTVGAVLSHRGAY
ncbi:sugar transferase [Nocardioides sp. Soil805]|uniref:sugar transferase n=1 Tax=Nocardioides sp. Soil805 TaxID=1736416 RepID=UPI00070355B1|nr:sugar transferase [Nocardioides sp. Soil805]KRF36851.1 hypothetical protein ASG94_05480 [Nocardioides sp. Soil805]